MNAVTVRDALAKRLLEEVGVKREIVVTSDPALLLSAKPFDEAMLKAEGRCRPTGAWWGLRARGRAGRAQSRHRGVPHLLANAADFVADRLDANVLFIPMERGDIREFGTR